MADVIISMKIMPESPEIDLNNVEAETKKILSEFAGETEIRSAQNPVAFGLKSLDITFVADESKGSTDVLEEKIKEINGVNSVEVTDVRRAIG